MEIEKLLKTEHLAYQNEKGDQKIYILPDEEAVEQLMARLREDGMSDSIQVSLSAQHRTEAENKQNETLLSNVADALTAPKSMAKVEQALGEYLATDGEQKVYVLPDELDVEQLLGSLTGVKTGEIKQSQMWRKTDVTLDNKEQSKMMAAMDQRIKQLELLLKQTTGQDIQVMDKEIE